MYILFLKNVKKQKYKKSIIWSFKPIIQMILSKTKKKKKKEKAS